MSRNYKKKVHEKNKYEEVRANIDKKLGIQLKEELKKDKKQ